MVLCINVGFVKLLGLLVAKRGLFGLLEHLVFVYANCGLVGAF